MMEYVYYCDVLCILIFKIFKYCSVSVNTDSTVAIQESIEIFEEETPTKVKKVELEIQSDKEDSSTSTSSDVGKFLLICHLI